jgi:hypothetical protein
MSRRLARNSTVTVVGGVSRGEEAFRALGATVRRAGRSHVLEGTRDGASASGAPGSVSAGWEARAALAVGAAIAHWLATDG